MKVDLKSFFLSNKANGKYKILTLKGSGYVYSGIVRLFSLKRTFIIEETNVRFLTHERSFYGEEM